MVGRARRRAGPTIKGLSARQPRLIGDSKLPVARLRGSLAAFASLRAAFCPRRLPRLVLRAHITHTAEISVDLNQFHGHGGGFAAADAEAGDALLAAAGFQGGEQGRQDARAASPRSGGQAHRRRR